MFYTNSFGVVRVRTRIVICYVREGRGGMVEALGFVIAAACRAGLNPAWGRFVGRFQCQ